mgnify:CR=1 FL=1
MNPNTDGVALLRRIKSLEDALGLIYVGKDFKDDYDEHVQRNAYGFVGRVEKFMRP